jgi:Holliday junction resolvasome RuvABC endonuclease subunit
MNFDLKYISELLQALLLATLPPLAALVAYYIKLKVNGLVLSLDDDKRRTLKQVVEIAVYAAEQLWKETPGMGEAKKKYVIKIVEEWIARSGLTVDVSMIDAMIEDAVFDILK